jgi:hypothetical protein
MGLSFQAWGSKMGSFIHSFFLWCTATSIHPGEVGQELPSFLSALTHTVTVTVQLLVFVP